MQALVLRLQRVQWELLSLALVTPPWLREPAPIVPAMEMQTWQQGQAQRRTQLATRLRQRWRHEAPPRAGCGWRQQLGVQRLAMQEQSAAWSLLQRATLAQPWQETQMMQQARRMLQRGGQGCQQPLQ